MSIALNEEKESQGDDAIICICESELDDNATIQCDRCGRWQHMRCVGIDPSVVDLDNLVYHCDQCEPRQLDVNAAKDYIESFMRDEMQTAPMKPRRGRGKGSGRRGGVQGSSHGARPDSKRTKSHKHMDSDGTDDMADSNTPISSLRDYTLIEDYSTTDEAAQWMRHHSRDYPACPATVAAQNISTSVRAIAGSNGILHGLFAERDAPANAFVGRYMGIIVTKEQYRNDPRNQFQTFRGPLAHVSFIQHCELAIDARDSGDESRYIRKSCMPNCAVVPLLLENPHEAAEPSWQFCVVLKEAIKAGDEVTLGYQWGEESPEKLPGLHSPGALESFLRNVNAEFGECACARPLDQCLIGKWRRRSQEPQSRKRSVSREVPEESVIEPANEAAQATEAAVEQQPMTREERKIQMAIARMENGDVPKVKRRRRNTGDENPRPTHRRASSMKVDESQITADDLRRSISPVVSQRTVKPSRPSAARAKLIRSPSPGYEVSDRVPRKVSWLRTFDKERAIKEEQRIKLAEQAKEATARLAEEATKKKMEMEASAREARESKLREAEVQRKRAEREAKEASQRAREREIWGDHPTTSTPVRRPPPLDLVEEQSATVTSNNSPRGVVVTAAQDSPLGRTESPTAMGPPTLPKETSKPSPPPSSPAVVPKIVRKLSVSEYMRQRKEKAANDVSASPTLEDNRHQDGHDAQRKDDDKSDGEIEAGEVEIKKEPSVAPMSATLPPSAPRGDFLQMPPTAPKASSLHQQQHHHPPAGPMVHPSRAYPANTASHMNHFPSYPRHNFVQDPRQGRASQNGLVPNGNNYPPHGSSSGSNYQRAPIPTGPKFSRSGSSGEPQNNPQLSYQPMANGTYGKDSNRPASHDHQ